MKIVKIVAIGAVVLVVAFIAIGFFLPRQVSVARSIVISAPPEKIFAILNGFKSFDRWSPWSDKDPNLKAKISGPASGVGARYEWAGNNKVGTGSQEITESQAPSLIRTQLVFGGFEKPSVASYTLTVTGSGTLVHWQIDSDLGGNPIVHYFGPMMDRMVGPDFEKGLLRLKALAEMPELPPEAPATAPDEPAPAAPSTQP